jgi:ABC-type multidrug transport system fused ATPase/permease subunit
MHRFRKLLGYVLRQWRMLLVILTCTLAFTATAALEPWPMKWLVDNALGDASPPEALASGLRVLGLEPSRTALVFAAAFAGLVLFALNSALGVALGLAWSVGGQRMVYSLAGDLFAKLQRLSLVFHGRRTVGDSLSRLTDDSWCLYKVANGLLMAPIQQVCTLVLTGSVAFFLDRPLAALVVALAPLLAASSLFFGGQLKRRARLGQEAKSRLLSFVHQTLGAVPMIQAFGAEARNVHRFRHLADTSVSLSQRGNLLGGYYSLTNGLITTAGTAAILYFGGLRVLSGAIPLGTLLVFLAYARQLQAASGGLFNIFAQLKAAEASVDRILDVMESDDSIRDAADARPLARPAEDAGALVCFEHVTFGYEVGRPVLDDVTLEAQPGEVVAIVGATGAGKSTLISLLPRFFDPWAGRILIEGTDIRKATLASLRQQVSVVLQEPFLLPLSVAKNISYGRPEATRQEIVAAAKAACADDFICRLSDGYDTVLGERGGTLSGGERQRLAIARALLKRAPVLILDEPTSALDVGTEDTLLQAMQRLIERSTTFMIAHRLSTIRCADRIVVLERGRIVEMGSHQELLERDGLYCQFHHSQFAHEQAGVLA